MHDNTSKLMQFIDYVAMLKGAHIFFFRVHDSKIGRYSTYFDFTKYHNEIGAIVFFIGILLLYKAKTFTK